MLAGTASTLSVTDNFLPSQKISSTPARSFFLLEKHSSAIRFLTKSTQVLFSKGTKCKNTKSFDLVFLHFVHPVGLGIVGINPHKGYLATLDVLNSTLSVWVVFYKMTQMTHPTRVLRGILRESFKIRNGLE